MIIKTLIIIFLDKYNFKMLSNTNIDKYNNLQFYYSSHEGELYITNDKSIIIKVYYFEK